MTVEVAAILKEFRRRVDLPVVLEHYVYEQIFTYTDYFKILKILAAFLLKNQLKLTKISKFLQSSE